MIRQERWLVQRPEAREGKVSPNSHAAGDGGGGGGVVGVGAAGEWESRLGRWRLM